MAKVVVLKDDCGRRFSMSVPDNTEDVVCIRDALPLDRAGSNFKINGYDFNKRDLAAMLIGLIDDGLKIAAIKMLRGCSDLDLKQCKDVIDELGRGNYCPRDFDN